MARTAARSGGAERATPPHEICPPGQMRTFISSSVLLRPSGPLEVRQNRGLHRQDKRNLSTTRRIWTVATISACRYLAAHFDTGDSVRKLGMLVLSGALASCGSAHKQASVDQHSENALDQIVEGPRVPKVIYPACADVWKGSGVSKCGRKVFEASLKACTNTVKDWRRSDNPVQIDRYTGDSWQERAGKSALLTESERASLLKKDDEYSWWQSISFALGNGTGEVVKFTCILDKELHLSQISGV